MRELHHDLHFDHRRRHGGPLRRGGGHPGSGGHRARRGAVGAAILTLLEEQPMHGYELIVALEERTGGRWRPSPGAIYPALARLEHKCLVTSSEHDGKRRYTLTDAGRERVAELKDAGAEALWAATGSGRSGDLRRATGELMGQTRQIGRFGSPAQISAAHDVLRDATRRIYELLATPPAATDETDADDSDGSGADDDAGGGETTLT